jgi:NAD(P)H dehydrogenase (quinone)
MKVLTIYAHPNPKSFCHAVLEQFSRGLKDAGHSNEVVDLYAIGFDPVWRARDAPNWMDENVPQDILARANLRQELLDGAKGPLQRFLMRRWLGDKDARGIIRALRERYRPKDVIAQQQKVAAAEALVFISPVWFVGFPAILKGWFDRVFTLGFAFGLSAEGWHGDVAGRIPLLTHKKALVINTTIFDESSYQSGFSDAMRRLIDDWCLHYPGVKVVEHVFFHAVNGADDATRAGYLERAYCLGRDFEGPARPRSSAAPSGESQRAPRDLVERLDPVQDFNFRHFRMRHMLAELLRTYRRSGVPVGAAAPEFELETTDGTRLRLSELRGRPVLLHFVSYTCPVTRGAAAPMRELHRRYGDRLQFLDIVVRQAHPGERSGAYSSFAEKLADARRYQQAEEISWRVAVDDLDGIVQRAYGGMSASIYLLDAEGRVAFYSLWGAAPSVTTAIEDLLARGGVGAPAGSGIDAVPHLGAALVAGQGGPARGGLRSFADLELGFPGVLALMGVGWLLRPVLAPVVQRISPRAAQARSHGAASNFG